MHAPLNLIVYPVDSDEELSHPQGSGTYRSTRIMRQNNAARPQTDTSTSSETPNNQPWHTMHYDVGWKKTRYINVAL